MSEYTLIGTARVVATVRADNETEALAEWRQIQRRLIGRRLAANIDLVVEGDKPRVFRDAGKALTNRHVP